MRAPPRLLVFDSGLGGLTVHRALRDQLPDAQTRYVADDAAFPYGDLADPVLVDRVIRVMGELIPDYQPDLVVIACNTASTLVLPALRAQFGVPFVGTVPAIKPAAKASQTRRIAILATPATIKRDYTQSLIHEFADGCDVILHAPPLLAERAETVFSGGFVSDAELSDDIWPCFVDQDGRRTDMIVLGCTHFPLLLDRFVRLAPWAVTWIDPAPAIARRVAALLEAHPPRTGRPAGDHAHLFLHTGDADFYQRMHKPLMEWGFSGGVYRPVP